MTIKQSTKNSYIYSRIKSKLKLCHDPIERAGLESAYYTNSLEMETFLYSGAFRTFKCRV